MRQKYFKKRDVMISPASQGDITFFDVLVNKKKIRQKGGPDTAFLPKPKKYPLLYNGKVHELEPMHIKSGQISLTKDINDFVIRRQYKLSKKDAANTIRMRYFYPLEEVADLDLENALEHHGISEASLRKAIDMARASGAKYFVFETPRVRATALAKKLGFEITKKRKFYGGLILTSFKLDLQKAKKN